MSVRGRLIGAIAVGLVLTLTTLTSHGEQENDVEIDQATRDQPERNDFDLPDSDGLKRDTWYFLGYQWVTIGVLYVVPETISNWSDEQKQGDYLSRWRDNVTNPQFDSDDLYLNYLLHPYWGAAYFVRAKERGYSDTGAFWYSMLLSSIYEFGAEAMFEEVSIQDVIFTPMLGSMLGQYFMNVRRDIRQRDFELGHRRTRDKWVWVLTDPLGAINRRMDRLLGVDTRLQVLPYAHMQRPEKGMRAYAPGQDEDLVYGLRLRLEF